MVSPMVIFFSPPLKRKWQRRWNPNVISTLCAYINLAISLFFPLVFTLTYNTNTRFLSFLSTMFALEFLFILHQVCFLHFKMFVFFFKLICDYYSNTVSKCSNLCLCFSLSSFHLILLVVFAVQMKLELKISIIKEWDFFKSEILNTDFQVNLGSRKSEF